jgi:hypothetical protein
LHHITSNWRDFALVQDSRGAADHDVGATLHVTSSVKDSTDALVSARVECEVQMHSSGVTFFNLLGSHDGVGFERPISKPQARVMLALVPLLRVHAHRRIRLPGSRT